jgi:hypothetical protein
MNRQPDDCTLPRHGVTVTTVMIGVIGVMMVVAEESFQQKHQQKPADRPHRSELNVSLQLGSEMGLTFDRFRQEIKGSNTEHQPRHEAQEELHLTVCQSSDCWKKTASNGCHDHEYRGKRQIKDRVVRFYVHGRDTVSEIALAAATPSALWARRRSRNRCFRERFIGAKK